MTKLFKNRIDCENI